MIIINSLFSFQLSFSQEFIYELDVDKWNVLFHSLKVKKQISHFKVVHPEDSKITEENLTIRYFDTMGFMIKKEWGQLYQDTTKSLQEYERNESGLCIKIVLNGKLRMLREYDNSNKLIVEKRYGSDNLSSFSFFKYDSLGNKILSTRKYSSGRVDTTSLTCYNYDFSATPPKIKSDTTFFKENNYWQKLISEYDSIGRCSKLITETFYNQSTDSVFYYYNEKNLFDSTVSFDSNGIRYKIIRKYDAHWRLTKKFNYDYNRSTFRYGIFSYDDKIYLTIDSIYKSKNLDIIIENKFALPACKLQIGYDTEGKETSRLTTEYYPNGLTKKIVKEGKWLKKYIEEESFEYEFY